MPDRCHNYFGTNFRDDSDHYGTHPVSGGLPPWCEIGLPPGAISGKGCVPWSPPGAICEMGVQDWAMHTLHSSLSLGGNGQ